MCPNCQAPLRGEADFCTNCGTRVRQQSAAGQAEPTRPASGQPQFQQAYQPAYPPPPAPGYPPPAAQGNPPPAGQGYPPPAGQGYPPPPAQGYPAPAPGYRPVPSPPGQPPAAAPGAATGSYHFDLGRLAVLDRTVAIASALTLIALFLPWFGYLGFTISGISAHGYLVVALLIDLALLGYLALRAGWQSLPVKLPIAHAPLLLVGTGVQFLLVLIAFLQSDGLSHEFGSYFALLAAVVACGAIAIPAIRAFQGGQHAGSQ